MKSMLRSKEGQGLFPSRPSWFQNFFDDDDFFGMTRFATENVPAVNVLEDEKAYLIELAAPGYRKGDFKVAVDNGVLTVSAEKRTEDKKGSERFMRREYNYASFSRAFTLPEDVRADDMRAEYVDGVLKIHLARVAEINRPEPQEIEIH